MYHKKSDLYSALRNLFSSLLRAHNLPFFPLFREDTLQLLLWVLATTNQNKLFLSFRAFKFCEMLIIQCLEDIFCPWVKITIIELEIIFFMSENGVKKMYWIKKLSLFY